MAVGGARVRQLAEGNAPAEVLDGSAGDVDGLCIVAEVEIHVRLAGRVGLHRWEADLHLGPFGQGLDRVFHGFGVGWLAQLEHEGRLAHAVVFGHLSAQVEGGQQDVAGLDRRAGRGLELDRIL